MTTTVLPGGPGETARRGAARHRLLLVGGGPACASVLIRLAARPDAGVDALDIVLVDAAGETGGGDPYPTGTSRALLLNDPLAKLDSSGIGFTEWLRAHRSRWWHQLVGDPDPRVRRWVQRNAAAVRTFAFDRLFLPRYLFGDFIRGRVAAAVRSLRARGVPVTVVTGRVTTVRRTASGWRAGVDTRHEPLDADTVVLGVGSLAPPPPAAVAGHPGYFSYRRARDVDALAGALRGPAAGPVAVLGSGAAAGEVLYLLEDAHPGELVVLSRSDRLPDGLPSGRPVPDHPQWTEWVGSTAAGLVDAVVAEVSAGIAAGYTVVDLLPGLGARFDRAFAALAPPEKRRFVEEHAPRYRAAIRHISADYAEAVRRLRATNRLTVRAAHVSDVDSAPDGGLRVSYLDGGRPAALVARAVFDCRGFVAARETDQPVVVDLLAGGAVRANACGRGLDVADDLTAAPGLYVLGPALAGTARGTDHIWSLENVPRIYTLAERVVAGVHRRIGAGR